MENKDLIKQAARRLAVATEILHQVWAIQAYQRQSLLEESAARDAIASLMDDFLAQSSAVQELIDEFLRNSDGRRGT